MHAWRARKPERVALWKHESVGLWKLEGWKHGAESPQEARPGSTNTKARAHTQTLLDRRVPKTERRPSHFHGRL